MRIAIVNVYDTCLEENKKEIIFDNNGQRFMGALFWKEKDWLDKEVTETYEEVNVDLNTLTEQDVKEIITIALEMMERNGLKMYKSTEGTMRHWQYMNGFSDIIFC